MTSHRLTHISTIGHGTIIFLVLCLFGLLLSVPASAQTKRQKPQSKLYLDHADDVSHDQMTRPDVVVVKGHVKFRYQGMTLACDSAFINEVLKSFQALGHVHMTRQDGTSLRCSRAFYQSGIFHARQKVVLRQPGKSLVCDSLDYSQLTNVASFFGGRGTLHYGPNTVVADRGDYNTKSHDANFFGNVIIRSPKYNIHTPTAHGNTESGLIHVTGQSVIRTRRGEVVHTNDGTYNSKTDYLQLNGHSTITSPARDVEGDDITYNNRTGYAEGHGNVRIHDKRQNRIITGEDVVYNSQTGYSEANGNAVVIDKKDKRTIKGDNLKYNSKTREGEGRGNVTYLDEKRKNYFEGAYVHYTDAAAIAYGGAGNHPGPMAKDFSQGDTLYVHADTLKMFASNVNTDSVSRRLYGINNVRAFRRDVQAMCNLMVAQSRDSSMTLYEGPIVWNVDQKTGMIGQLLGDSIRVLMNDSTVRDAYVYGNAMSIQEIRDKSTGRADNAHYNQVSSKSMWGHFDEGHIRYGEAIGNVMIVYYPIDDHDSTLIGLNYTLTDTLRMYLSPEQRLQKIWMPKAEGTLYPMTQIPHDKMYLRGFDWFADVRPHDKDDIFRPVSKSDHKRVYFRLHKAPAAPPRQRIPSGE